MEENRMTGRVTIPTDLDVVPETLEILLHHPQGQRVGQGEPGRGAAVLHYDRLLHRPR